MGTIDKLWVKLTCPSCGATETLAAVDRGSGYGGSAWGDLGPYESFEVTESAGDKQVPQVTSATCNACGATATVEREYGHNRPRGF